MKKILSLFSIIFLLLLTSNGDLFPGFRNRCKKGIRFPSDIKNIKNWEQKCRDYIKCHKDTCGLNCLRFKCKCYSDIAYKYMLCEMQAMLKHTTLSQCEKDVIESKQRCTDGYLLCLFMNSCF